MSLAKKTRSLKMQLMSCKPRLIWGRLSWNRRLKIRRWMWIQRLNPPIPVKRYRAPVSRKAVEPTSTVENHGSSGQQEAATRSNSAPKGRSGYPTHLSCTSTICKPGPIRGICTLKKLQFPEASGTV